MEVKKTVKDLSFPFAIRIVKLQQQLVHEKKEFNLSRQIMRSGTSIGANIDRKNGQKWQKRFELKRVRTTLHSQFSTFNSLLTIYGQ